MPINYSELLNAAEVVARHHNMKVTMKCTAAASTFTGLTTMGGGLLGGPIGIALGAIVGGISAALYTQGKFKPVVEIIRELSPREKRRLCEHLHNAIKDVTAIDVINLAYFILSHENLFIAFSSALKTFLTDELKHQLG